MTRIITLGPQGSYSEEAAVRFGNPLSSGVEISLLGSPSEVLNAVGNGDLGLVAIENSLNGPVEKTLDLIRVVPHQICGEVILEIRHSLMRRERDDQPISRIYSHQQALGQCGGFLETHYQGCEFIETSSTAQGAILASMEPGSAAIASPRAAEVYGLRIIAMNVQDKLLGGERNFTRFIIIGGEVPASTGNDKTSVVFTIQDIPAALYKALEPFAKREINLTNIMLRPLRSALGSRIFFLDFRGHQRDKEVSNALCELEEACVSLRVLGSYPAAPIP